MQSLGWEHYEVHEPEPHILLFKYILPTSVLTYLADVRTQATNRLPTTSSIMMTKSAQMHHGYGVNEFGGSVCLGVLSYPVSERRSAVGSQQTAERNVLIQITSCLDPQCWHVAPFALQIAP